MTKLRRIAQVIEDLKTLNILKEDDEQWVSRYTDGKFVLFIYLASCSNKYCMVRDLFIEEFPNDLQVSEDPTCLIFYIS